MRSLFVLALLSFFCLAATVGCAPVPGGPALSNATASGDAAAPGVTETALPGTTIAPTAIAPQVTSAE
jgi:hypothetical protein